MLCAVEEIPSALWASPLKWKSFLHLNKQTKNTQRKRRRQVDGAFDASLLVSHGTTRVCVPGGTGCVCQNRSSFFFLVPWAPASMWFNAR